MQASSSKSEEDSGNDCVDVLDRIEWFNETQQDVEMDDEVNGDDDDDNEDSSKQENDTAREKDETQEDNQEWELDLEGLDDSELDECLLGEDEIEVKTKLWMEENGEFMEKLKEREEKAALELEAKLKSEGFKKRKVKRKKVITPADSAEEAIHTMLTERKLSTKINYDVLRDLAAEGGVDVKTMAKSEPKTETDEKTLDISKMPVIYESGPVQRKLKFRSGMKRTQSLQNTISLTKKIKTEHWSSPQSSSTPLRTLKQEDTEKSTSEEIQSFARTKTEKAQEEHLKPAIVESGPVQVDDDIVEDFDNDTENDEEDNEEEHISASQLLGFGKADDGYEEDEYAEYQEEWE